MFDFRKLAVFVPANTTEPIASIVASGSAIVGLAESSAEQVTVYYEGNLHSSANIKTYADRARLAADRLTAHYPTVARTAVPRNALRQVGWFDPENGITLLDDVQVKEALACWLGVEVIEETELHFSN